MYGYGITFNDIHSSDFNIAVTTNSNPLLPSLRVSEEAIPNKSSSYKFIDGYEDRLIILTFQLLEDDYIEKRNTARLVAKWLTGKSKLVFDYEPDKYYMAQVFSQIDTEIAIGVDNIQVSFLCDPFSYSDEIQVSSDNIISSTSISLINNGTYISKPFIEITGTATTISFTSDGGSFSINNILEKTIVDCEKMLCYSVDGLGQKTNKLKDFTGKFIEIEAGSVNVDVTGISLNVDVIVKMHDTYL